MKSVFQYPSYRDFIRAAYLNAKSGRAGLTLKTYASKFGIGHSSLKMILIGKRNLTLPQAHSISKVLKFSSGESAYFEALVLKERAKKKTEIKNYTRRAQSAKADANLQGILLARTELLSDIYTLPVLVYLSDILHKRSGELILSKEEKKELATAFGVAPAVVETALHNLARTTFESGDTTQYVFDRTVGALNQKQYLKNWLLESINRLETEFESRESLFTTSTISLSEENFEALNKELKKVVEKYLSMPSKEVSVLAQVGIQSFVVARTPKTPNK